MSIEQDIKRLIKNIKNVERKQVPFAASVALNKTAEQVKTGIERQLKKDIDRPTPFTQKAFKVNRSTKTRLISSVEIKPIQAKYLRYQIEGGSRRGTKDSPVIIPRKGQQNKYGNLPRGKLSKLKSQGKSYISNNVAYQRLKKSSKPLAYFASKASYTKRFKFYERGHSTAKKVIVKNFKEALKNAIRTSR